MKANRGERPKPFTPIIITIETEEEADLMWHILNIAREKSLIDYFEVIGEKVPATLKSAMFRAYLSAYRDRWSLTLIRRRDSNDYNINAGGIDNRSDYVSLCRLTSPCQSGIWNELQRIHGVYIRKEVIRCQT